MVPVPDYSTPPRRWRHLALLAVLAAAVAIFLAACGGGGSSSGGGGGTGSTESSSGSGEREPINVSFLTTKTGGCAPNEEPVLAGMEIAAEKLNEKGIEVGGKEYELAWHIGDTKGENTEAITVVRNQIAEGIQYFLGPDCSISTLPGVTALFEQAGPKVLAINNIGSPAIGSSNKQEAIEAAEGPSHNLFSDTLAPLQQGVRDSYLVSLFPNKPKKVFLMLPNNEFGEALESSFGAGLDKQGIEHETVLYEPTAKDFSGYLAKAKAYGAEVLVGPYEPEPALAILRQALQLETVPAFLGYGVPIEQALETAIGKPIPIPAVWDEHPVSLEYTDNPALKELAKELEAKSGGKLEPNASYAATQYDFVGMLVAAMEKAGTISDPTKVAEALKEIEFESGWFGTLKYDRTNHVPTTTDGCYIEPPGEVQPCLPVGVEGVLKE